MICIDNNVLNPTAISLIILYFKVSSICIDLPLSINSLRVPCFANSWTIPILLGTKIPPIKFKIKSFFTLEYKTISSPNSSLSSTVKFFTCLTNTDSPLNLLLNKAPCFPSNKTSSTSTSFGSIPILNSVFKSNFNGNTCWFAVLYSTTNAFITSSI